MKLFLVSQTERGDYDTFDSMVVAAPDEDAARRIHPIDRMFGEEEFEIDWLKNETWCSSPEQATVRYIGKATVGVK